MQLQPLISDWLFYLMLASFCLVCYKKRGSATNVWHTIFSRPGAMSSTIIISLFLLITALDCIHFKTSNNNFRTTSISVIDKILQPIATSQETTYSAPLATTLAVSGSSIMADGGIKREFKHLKYVPKNIDKNKTLTNPTVDENIFKLLQEKKLERTIKKLKRPKRTPEDQFKKILRDLKPFLIFIFIIIMVAATRSGRDEDSKKEGSEQLDDSSDSILKKAIKRFKKKRRRKLIKMRTIGRQIKLMKMIVIGCQIKNH